MSSGTELTCCNVYQVTNSSALNFYRSSHNTFKCMRTNSQLQFGTCRDLLLDQSYLVAMYTIFSAPHFYKVHIMILGEERGGGDLSHMFNCGKEKD